MSNLGAGEGVDVKCGSGDDIESGAGWRRGWGENEED